MLEQTVELSNEVKEFINNNRGFVIGIMEEYNFEENTAQLLVYDLKGDMDKKTHMVVKNMDDDVEWIKQYVLYVNEQRMMGQEVNDLIVMVKNYREDLIPTHKHTGNIINLNSLYFQELPMTGDGKRLRGMEIPVIEVIEELHEDESLVEHGTQEYLINCVLPKSHPLVSRNQEGTVIRAQVRVRVSAGVEIKEGLHQALVVTVMEDGETRSYINIITN